MAFVPPKDRVLEHSSTSGTGPWTLANAGVDTSYNAFSAWMADGDTTIGFIIEPGVAMAVGVITFASSGPTITLTQTIDSKGTFGGGTKEIGMGLPAQVFHDDTRVGMKNRLINPSGKIQQAGLASTSNGNYSGFDQWICLNQSNPVTPSQVTNAENATPSMMRITQANASAQRFGLIQWIENANCDDLRGRVMTLSARVRMSASTTLRYAILEWTGTADSITKDVVNSWTNGTFTAGQFFKSTTMVVTATRSIALTANTLTDIAPLTGTIGSSANNIAAFFWTDSTQAQNVTLDIGKAQLEIGYAPTPHARRSFQDELILCQRQYYKTFEQGTAPAQNAGLAGSFGLRIQNGTVVTEQEIRFPVPMRVTPTGTLYNPSNTNSSWRDATASSDITSGIESITTMNAFVDITSAGTNEHKLRIHLTADARL